MAEKNREMCPKCGAGPDPSSNAMFTEWICRTTRNNSTGMIHQSSECHVTELEERLAKAEVQLRGYANAHRIILEEFGLPKGSQDAVARIRELSVARHKGGLYVGPEPGGYDSPPRGIDLSGVRRSIKGV